MLPGLDGTGRLFDRVAAAMSPGCRVESVGYPGDRLLDAGALLARVESVVPTGVRHVVVGESFSGPIAVRYAARRPSDVAALVLCASFVENPMPAWLRWLPRLANPALLAVPPPRWIIRALLVGWGADADLVREIRSAVRSVRAKVLAARIRSLATVDVAEDLERLDMPVLYLAASNDRMLGSRGLEQVRRVCPSVEVRTLESSHLVLQCDPEGSASAILEFLESNGVG